MTKVGCALKEHRQENEMSLRAVQFVSGISNAHICQIEKGKRYPSFKTIAILSIAYELEYLDIINLYERCLEDLEND